MRHAERPGGPVAEAQIAPLMALVGLGTAFFSAVSHWLYFLSLRVSKVEGTLHGAWRCRVGALQEGSTYALKSDAKAWRTAWPDDRFRSRRPVSLTAMWVLFGVEY